MTIWRFYTHNAREFFRHWGTYIILIGGTNLFISTLLIPIFTNLAQLIVAMGHVSYLSYTNFLQVMTQKPLTVLLLALLLIVMMLAVYWQFAFTIIGLQAIYHDQRQPFWQHVKASFISFKNLRPLSVLLLLGYFIVILPFGHIIFSSRLLDKIQIPDFIVTFITTKPLLSAILLTIYVVILYFAVRLITFVPILVTQKISAKKALQQSWRVTKHRFWGVVFRVALVNIMNLIVAYGIELGIYLLQHYFDVSVQKWALTAGIINLGIVQLVFELLAVCNTMMLLRVAIQLAEEAQLIPAVTVQKTLVIRHRIWRRVFAVLILLGFAGTYSLYNYVYLKGMTRNAPLVISHRGVDDGNGVQNTIPALQKTSKEHPDMVEMDIHETKDNQFIVMHDENLQDLTGVNAKPRDLTLAQLTKLTARENGQAAKVASFDDYLSAAEKLHQKLLVEIKTTKQDSPNMLNNFIQKYEKRLLADKDQIHSLDYNVVAGLKKKAPKLFVSYIMPYNLIFPRTKANAYTMEMSTVDADFVTQASAAKQKTYAWTVDDENSMQKMLFLNVDGIISDDVTTLQQVIKANLDHPSYAKQILQFNSNLPSFGSAPEN
ncbi:glycerophosphodiester phosphodiesterase [Agrilactobacillus composti DSM 18527 = JCM 14202]|uniref:Glycerophosphodiester phosphodiesterase n=1 Tax=Agrilactobacillus composti DSM 18527 = JCM 14202 TaxID=1423734 RepID=X0PPG0_9LACO|nr:glycerophosphodiester phosphodiesterase [Agrilactobacillus composti]KRM31099.1 glycerophosphodiester phosphodiesterase [Agrilactobacillus composti DSM 18527 = JCM 14202]GAF39517.1 glycerophosphoryl diester phosphodiesterase [Agrilactobacillus composti DSM 18527 = JCM 14202]